MLTNRGAALTNGMGYSKSVSVPSNQGMPQRCGSPGIVPLTTPKMAIGTPPVGEYMAYVTCDMAME